MLVSQNRFATTLLRLLVLSLAAVSCAAPASTGGGGRMPAAADPPPPVERRAIVVAFDSFNERRLLETLDSSAVPELRSLLRGGACAAYARPAFPSVTAPGLASVFTGAYGDVSGIAANSQPTLPRDEHSLLDRKSGFSIDALRAEPIWITAGAAGTRVVAHHATHATGAPGYPPVEGTRDSAAEAARQRALQVLARPHVATVNGYEWRVLSRDLALDERTAPPREARGWVGLEPLGATVPPREIAWAVGQDSIFALLHGANAYTHVLVARTRDARAGVVARVADAERAPVAGRPLARHFSEALEIPAGDSRGYLRVRLFALAPDASSYLLYQPAVTVIAANTPEAATAYAAATRGWLGNGPQALLDQGRFGASITDGGDGTAELRFLEGSELVARQLMRGSEWAWSQHRATLLLDYMPIGDQIDHTWYGLEDPASPHHAAATAARARELRERGWSIVDAYLGHLQRLVGSDPGAALFVTGDHGMRATWRLFRPNVALANLGLLGLDSASRIDLSRTRALSPNGYWVSVNRTAWRGGIVAPEEEAAVLEQAERALLLARAPDGSPVVTRVWRAAEHDSLGLGGPVGGDLYYSVAEGYRWTGETTGGVTAPASPSAGHGFPSTEPDMRTVLCARGAAFPAGRSAPARTIDMAPTVAAWLGIPAPPHATGRSVLTRLLGSAGVSR